MKLTILILTHNRPELFKRCITSALKNKPQEVEILVNNDSLDIEEISGAEYFYKQDNNLSNIYNFLIQQAQGEYLYFLEDDDYLLDNFYNRFFENYNKQKTMVFNYMPAWGPKYYFDRFYNKIKNGEYKKKDFLDIVNKEYFQLGQFIFRKQDICEYMQGNFLDNDWKLFININNDIIYNQEPIYQQTIDGKDNISFENFCSDKRFKGQI